MEYILRERLGWDNLGEDEVERMRRSVVPSGKGGLFEVEGEEDIDVRCWDCADDEWGFGLWLGR